MVVTTTYTIEEFDAIQKKQKHPYIGLFNMDGSRLVAFNAHGTETKEKIAEIRRSLDSPSLTDGVYLIVGKNSLSKNMASFEYPVIVGNPDEATLSEEPEAFNSNNVPVTSYQEALKSANRITELEFQNGQLAKDLAEAEEALREMVETHESHMKECGGETDEVLSEQPSFISNLQDWSENIMQLLNPAIEKHLELREKKLGIEQQKIDIRRTQGNGNKVKTDRSVENNSDGSVNENIQSDAVDYADGKIREFISFHEEDEDMHELMANCYNNAETMDAFFTTFQEEVGEEGLNDLVNHINGRGTTEGDEQAD